MKKEEKSGRRIHLLTIYNRSRSLQDVENDYVTLQKVEAFDEKRLSHTNGNVNLTSLWFKMLGEDESPDLTHTCRYVGLIDDEAEDGFWDREQEENVLIGFVKIRRDKRGQKPWKSYLQVKEAEKKLRTILGDKGWIFRTFDNADYVVIFFADQEEVLREIRNKLKDIKGDDGEGIYYSYFFVHGRIEDRRSSYIKVGIDDENPVNLEGNYILKHNFEGKVCVRIANEIKNKIKDSNRNKKKAAYYQALYAIVNIIAQYEQDTLKKHLFYLVYPQLQLFWEQLQESEERLAKLFQQTDDQTDQPIMLREKYDLDEKWENSFSEFLDAMEELIHHIGPSYHNEFQGQAYGGSLYDIPIGLSMLYVSYLHAVTEVLNTKSGSYEYRYCLIPVAYSRPKTTYFDFGLPPQSRLIKVMISRHMMFMVRPMLIALAHEVSHYVGDRMRKERAECVIDMLSYYLTEELWQEIKDPGKGMKCKTDVFIKIKQELRKRVKHAQCSYVEKEKDRVKTDKICLEDIEDEFYFFNNLQDNLMEIVIKLLSDLDDSLADFIDAVEVNDLIKAKAAGGKESMGYLFSQIKEAQEQFKSNRETLLKGSKVKDFLDDVKYNLREIYADLSAICVLRLEPLYYLESFMTTEGYVPELDTINLKLLNRISLVDYVRKEDENWKKSWRELEQKENRERYIEEIQKRVALYEKGLVNAESPENSEVKSNGGWNLQNKQDYFENKEVLRVEVEYVRKCHEKLMEVSGEQMEALELVRSVFEPFKAYDKGEEFSAETMFERCEALEDHYKEKIQNLYDSKKNSTW